MLSKIHDNPAQSAAPGVDLAIVDSKRLQMFYVAAVEGSFAAAAQRLGVSPSAISHALKGLEEDLGRSLFKRSGPRVIITGAAIRLLPLVEDLLSRMSALKTELLRHDSRAEKLCLRVSPSARGILTSAVLSSFRECFPNADLNIQTCHSHFSGSGITPDFEIGYSPEIPADSVQRKLLDETLGVYAAPFHPLGLQGKITSQELLRHCLVFPGSETYDHFRQEFLQDTGNGLRKWILPDAESARDLAKQGQCLALLPDWIGKDCVADGSLTLLRHASGQAIRRPCYAWWSPSQPLIWIAEVFLSLLAGEFEENG
ncbi:LysR family transcriptional regulator [Luteolibacter algae]|uniref:LysR family transcriptional regulator n=1 Tax=Luteolibacter algae TaxID=454151 RepID=A0ABW5D5B9_9BACT